MIRTPSAAIILGTKSVWTNVPIAGDAVRISQVLQMDVRQRKVLDVLTALVKTVPVNSIISAVITPGTKPASISVMRTAEDAVGTETRPFPMDVVLLPCPAAMGVAVKHASVHKIHSAATIPPSFPSPLLNLLP